MNLVYGHIHNLDTNDLLRHFIAPAANNRNGNIHANGTGQANMGFTAIGIA